MSTRANIHFTEGNRTVANIYRHSDGYPSGLGADLHRFLDEVGKLRDNRFQDAEYLAAKYLVWQAGEYNVEYIHEGEEWKSVPKSNRLDFLSVSPCIQDHGDIQYLYKVSCSTGRPKVFVCACDNNWQEITNAEMADTIS